jgi:DNA-binding transcriptional LysR family regulator
VSGSGASLARRHALAAQPLLLRESGSATRQVTEGALTDAGIPLVLPHTEAIKQGALAGLGVAFLFVDAMQGERATGRLQALRVRGLRIVPHFHLIHHERRWLSAAALAFMELMIATVPDRTPHRTGSGARSG